MWRRNGRAPNELVGVGFAAQAFGKAVHYDVNQASRTSRAAWIRDGVTDDEGRIGTSGLGGGAAAQELDRYDTRLGSPEHAVVLFETPAGGAVFSVGSISWFGALARNRFNNDIAHMTANVVRRFADPEPFVYETNNPNPRDQD